MLTPKQRWQNIRKSWESIFKGIINRDAAHKVYNIGFSTPLTTYCPKPDVLDLALKGPSCWVKISYYKHKEASESIIRFLLCFVTHHFGEGYSDSLDLFHTEDFDGPWLGFLEKEAIDYKSLVEETIRLFPEKRLAEALDVWEKASNKR